MNWKTLPLWLWGLAAVIVLVVARRHRQSDAETLAALAAQVQAAQAVAERLAWERDSLAERTRQVEQEYQQVRGIAGRLAAQAAGVQRRLDSLELVLPDSARIAIQTERKARAACEIAAEGCERVTTLLKQQLGLADSAARVERQRREGQDAELRVLRQALKRASFPWSLVIYGGIGLGQGGSGWQLGIGLGRRLW
jgi:hypothetical protein